MQNIQGGLLGEQAPQGLLGAFKTGEYLKNRIFAFKRMDERERIEAIQRGDYPANWLRTIPYEDRC